MYNQDDLQPINRNYIIVGVIVLVFFTTSIFGILYNNQQVAEKPITATQPEANGKEINLATLSKYDEDSDGDKIPNFMEEVLGLNVYGSEVTDCQSKIVSCQESPLSKINKINIIMDASTSMNIVGRGQQKIDEVRNEVKAVLNAELNKQYYQVSIYSFGNRGMQGNIPDNESCISILRHKSLATPLTDPNISSNDFLKTYIPNGKSPVAYSLDQVTKTLNKDENNLVFLIVDSVDDCNGDVKRIITESKRNNLVKKVNLATYFANEDANIYYKDAIESNQGIFSQNPNLREFISVNSKNFIKENWCKNDGINKIKTCIENKYKAANSYLNDQKNNRNIPNEERVKITNAQSIMSFFLQTSTQKLDENLEKDFENYFKNER